MLSDETLQKILAEDNPSSTRYSMIQDMARELLSLRNGYAFAENQRLCVGYDGGCDGDLTATEHEEGCPALVKDKQLRPYLYAPPSEGKP